MTVIGALYSPLCLSDFWNRIIACAPDLSSVNKTQGAAGTFLCASTEPWFRCGLLLPSVSKLTSALLQGVCEHLFLRGEEESGWGPPLGIPPELLRAGFSTFVLLTVGWDHSVGPSCA